MSISKMSNFIKQKSSLGPTYVPAVSSSFPAHPIQQRSSNRWGWGCFLSRQRAQCSCRVPPPGHRRHVLLLYYLLWRARGRYFPFPPFSTLTPHSGGFDTPKPKCPPDRGSSDCVTGSPASIFSASNSSYFYSPSNPRPIPSRDSSSDLATPPLTPDNGSPVSTSVSDKHQKDGLDFLMTIFPRHGLAALPYSRSVAISAPNLGAAFDGVVLQLPGKPKTLYVDGKSAQSVSIRERWVRILRILSS